MKHLTSEQISKLVAGSVAEFVEEEQHCRECRACAAELARFRDVLSMYRNSVRTWTEKQNQSEFPVVLPAALRPDAVHRQSLTWVLVGTGLALAIAVPVYREARERQIKAQADQDIVLTENVSAHLSRTVPVAMNSLMQLMSAGNGGSAGGAIEPNDGKQRSIRSSSNSPSKKSE